MKINNNNKNEDRKKLVKIIDLLKLGVFSENQLLIEMMNESNDDVVINLCLRVFCSISDQSDIGNVENLKMLSDSDEYIVNVFVTYSKQTLSYEVVPYLLALLEEWNDTYVETTIRDSLKDILGYQKSISENASVDEIGEFYLNSKEKINSENYYYKGELAIPGTLTKELLDASALSRKNGERLHEITIPTMLSIWSGIECPVQYHTVVDDEIMRKVIDYVKRLSKMNWERGCKYFYGLKV